MTEIEERLTAIEMKLAFMEDFVRQIQEVAVEQAKTIDMLKKENKLISDRPVSYTHLTLPTTRSV